MTVNIVLKGLIAITAVQLKTVCLIIAVSGIMVSLLSAVGPRLLDSLPFIRLFVPILLRNIYAGSILLNLEILGCLTSLFSYRFIIFCILQGLLST